MDLDRDWLNANERNTQILGSANQQNFRGEESRRSRNRRDFCLSRTVSHQNEIRVVSEYKAIRSVSYYKSLQALRRKRRE